MKNLLFYLGLCISTPLLLSCGWGWSDGMTFYNLFRQTNIAAEEFYPFLNDESQKFYEPKSAYSDERPYPKGNIELWASLLDKWERTEIDQAVYEFESFDWKKKNSKLEKSVKDYLEFAHGVSQTFYFRNNLNSWNYEEIIQQNKVHHRDLVARAHELMSDVKEEQIKARYYYQIIKILHYTKNWEEAVKIFEEQVEAKFEVNEIYYYILDQVAGCYYSTGNYEKAAYLFTKVVNHSIDRKKSAFVSFSFCTYQDAQGLNYFEGEEDKKDHLFMKSIRDFSDDISNIEAFIQLDPSDERVELLFMRALNNVEREVWPKGIGSSDRTLPYYKKEVGLDALMKIAMEQIENNRVENKDFWILCSSYLSFVNLDIDHAEEKLNKVEGYKEQKKVLQIAYEVFKWDAITVDNEEFLYNSIQDMPEEFILSYNDENDLNHLILDKVAHTYYKNNEIAKAYLVHNSLENLENLGSHELLDALAAFYQKGNPTEYEKLLLSKKSNNYGFMDYIYHQKGILYLLEGQPKKALSFFEKSKEVEIYAPISALIFSNNTIECFECDADYVMEDEVYKASAFDFIAPSFTRKQLAQNLIQLEEMRTNKTDWKAKLANYLLANYYFNISNTGYYRGEFTGRPSLDSRFFSYTDRKGVDIIADKQGYNLSSITYYPKNYYALSAIAKEYYQKTIDLSSDRELNARCLYMMAKCDLNDFYNNGGDNTFKIQVNRYYTYTIELPKSRSYKLLKHKYYDTKFHKMIIQQCSYFRYYSALN